jgi:hypothetical protein
VSEELEVLKTVARRLDEARIAYMLTGSMALNYYAVPRMTRDIDVVVELGPDDADRVIRLFETDFYIDPDAVRRAVATRGMFNLIHDRFVVKVDFVVRKDSEYRREEFARRRQVDVEGQPLWIVTPEDLVIGDSRMTAPADRDSGLLDLRRFSERAFVSDTSPEVERRYRELLLQRSGEERLRMGCSMHATAQALVRASMLARDPQASPAVLRRALFLRFYGGDFDADSRARILARLERG